MSTAHRVIKNTGFLYARTIVSLLVSVFTTRILLQALGASDYGLYNVVGGAISMLSFLSATMSTTTQRFMSYAEGEGKHENIRKIFANAIIIHRGLAALSVILLALGGLLFFNGIFNIPEGQTGAAMAVYGCMIITTVFSLTISPYDAVLNAHENMLFYSLLGIGDVILKLAIALSLLIFDSERLVFYACLMAAESMLLRYATQLYCRKHYAECRVSRILSSKDNNCIKEMLSFAGWNLTEIATSMISLSAINIIINHYFGTQYNAAVGIATQVAGVMMGVSANMIKAVTPVIVKSEGAHDRTRMLSLTVKSCKFSFLLFSFLSAPIVTFLPFILGKWLTIVPPYTATFCVIMISCQILEQLSTVLFQSIQASGNIRNYMITRSIANALPTIISILMCHYLHVEPFWVLLNWLIYRGIVIGIINLTFAKLNLGLSVTTFLRSALCPVFIAFCLSAISATVIKDICPQSNIAQFTGILISYIVTLILYYSIAFNRTERSMVCDTISHIIPQIVLFFKR